MLLIATVAASAGAQVDQTALQHLQQALADPQQSAMAMMALRTTKDADLLPLFAAMMQNEDKKIRLFATISIADLAADGAADVLAERLTNDPVMAVRAEAVAQLGAIDGVPISLFVEALAIADENVQLTAARVMIAKDTPGPVINTLEKLIESADANIAVTARLLLLAAGDVDQLPVIRQFAAKLKTDDLSEMVVGVLLALVADLEIASAAPLAQDVIAMESISIPLRIQAWRTIAAVGNDVADDLTDAISQAKSMRMKLQLLKVLASRNDAPKYLQRLAGSDNEVVAALADFELARLGGGSSAADIALTAMELGHPVVVDYMLDQAAQDIATYSQSNELYVPALLSFIATVRADSARMDLEHLRAAQATALLADHGSPQAMEALTELLNRRYNAMSRAVAAGLMRSDNAAVCDLVRPMLTSPYVELANDAAITLGKFRDDGAAERLGEILANPSRYEPALSVLAGWYLIQLNKQGPAAAKLLADAFE